MTGTSLTIYQGIKPYINNGLNDLKVQIHQDIYNTFPDDTDQDARLLAHDMYTSLQVFGAEISGWMDMLYQELPSISEATEEEARELVSTCVKRCWKNSEAHELQQQMQRVTTTRLVDVLPTCGLFSRHTRSSESF
jgi:hypothetical protein